MTRSWKYSALLTALSVLHLCIGLGTTAQGQGTPPQKIGSVDGGFSGSLDNFDAFGSATANLGDLDGDGINDLAVGAPNDDDGGVDAGAVWVLFLNANGTVKAHAKISANGGGLSGELAAGGRFGLSLARFADLDNDGISELAVLSVDRLLVLFLGSDGTVRGHTEVSVLDQSGQGRSVANIGDLDGDGTPELAVGHILDSGIETVSLVFMNPDGTARLRRRVTDSETGFSGAIKIGDRFGASVTAAGDVDGDGVPDLAVGAPRDDDGGANDNANIGAVWILFLEAGGEVKSHQKISATQGGFELFDPVFDVSDHFGISVVGLGDLDGDGVPDLAAGADLDDDGAVANGAVWVLFLRKDGTVRVPRKISSTQGEFIGQLSSLDFFGSSLSVLGDINGDGVQEIAVGAVGDDGTGTEHGAVWILYNLPTLAAAVEILEISPVPAVTGQDIVVTARIVAVGGIEEAEVSFRRAGDATFFTADLVEQPDGLWKFSIPAFVVGPRGVEGFLTVTNTNGTVTQAPQGEVQSIPVHVPQGLSIPVAHGNASDSYRLVSVPLGLENRSARAVLEDDLGPYDITRWRFFGFDNFGEQIELDVEDMEMQPGRAFWLLVKDANRIVNTGPGTSLFTNGTTAMPLRPGWNMIGNLFAFPMPLSNVTLASGFPVDIRAYDGTWDFFDGPMLPFEGYAVFNYATGQDFLVFNPDLSPVEASSSALRTLTTSKTGGLDWAIRILATQDKARDSDNLAGSSESGYAGWDTDDRPEPPVIGDYVSVYFPHPEWGKVTANYSTDARQTGTSGETWFFEVVSAQSGVVDLSFENLNDVPADYEIWLVDDVLHIRQDLRKDSRYSVVSNGQGIPKRLQLVAGTASYVSSTFDTPGEQPETVSVLHNYPNPFNGATTIRYTLSGAGPSKLSVFDLLGRLVITLVDESQDAGWHAAAWSGRDEFGAALPSGVYMLRLDAGGVVVSRAVTLTR